MRERKRLGDILLEAGKISVAQLNRALDTQRKTRRRLGEVLVSEGLLTEEEIADVLAKQLSLERVDLENTFVEQDMARSIPKEVAQKYVAIPIYMRDDKLVVAMSDPLNMFAIDDICFITQKKIQPAVATKNQIERAIEVYYSKQDTDKAIEELKREFTEALDESKKQDTELSEDIQTAPAVKLTNSIINQAIATNASDIHIEPFENYVAVRYRVDGVLFEMNRIPQNLYSAVSTRIKIMAGMNIAEKRLPQDGRIELEDKGKSYDFRVSSLPTVFGEKIVIRVLDRTTFDFTRDKLGFTEHENEM
ncbi:MAG TPA: ATPase, T2SS/T4P/T4SS family, partial [Clostridia bacterium]